MTDAQIRAEWNGHAFAPAGNFSRAWCLDELKPGEIVGLEVMRPRSGSSHRHQFAEINDLWATLPESMQHAPYAQSAEALRKHALIATGHCDIETIDAGTKAAAERVAPVVSSLARKAHGYCVVSQRGPIVQCYTPHSQSVRAMGGKAFQESKTDVLEWIGRQLSGPDAIGGEFAKEEA